MASVQNSKLATPTSTPTTLEPIGFFAKLWHEMEPTNPLGRTFFVTSQTLTYFRIFTFIVETITLVWTFIVVAPPNQFIPSYWTLCAFLTIWAFMICYFYNILVLFWGNAPDNSRKWKIVYILGELGFTLELMICPFFFAIIFPGMLMIMPMTRWDILYNIVMHFVVPVLMWLDTLFSNLAFPKRHRVILHLFIVAYLINNLAWTIILKRPVYDPVDWVSVTSYIIKIFAIWAVIGGFNFGEKLHKWKQQKFAEAGQQLKKE